MNVNWIPISLAPKDGTWILLAGGRTSDEEIDRSIAVAHFTDDLNGESGPNFEHWEFARYDGGFYGYYENPTHWMPLPPPPEQP